jgi:hypothetical protein
MVSWKTIQTWEDVMPGKKRAEAGRKKGEQKKVSAVRPGESRLDYMLRIMRDPKQEPSLRMAMAKAALPYCHTPLPPVNIPWGER